MKNVIFLLLAFLTTLNLHAKGPIGDNVDPMIEAKFKKEFGATLNVSWKIVNDVSIATFMEHGEERDVYYESDGEFFGFGKVISRSLLPETVSRSIYKRFGSAVIQSVYEFKAKESATRYIVYLYSESHFRIVSADEFGDVSVCRKTRYN